MMNNSTAKQMELGGKNSIGGIVNVRQQKLQRARWWFGKMRQVVDLAMPPQPMVGPRPEQTSLRLASFRAPGQQ